MAEILFLQDRGVLVWLTVSHALFLVVPALIAATHMWLHRHDADVRFIGRIQNRHEPYPHYLAA